MIPANQNRMGMVLSTAWVFTRLALWIWAFVVPLGLAFVIVGTFSDKLDAGTWEAPGSSLPGFRTAAVILFAAPVVMGWTYILKYRKRHREPIVAKVFVGLICLLIAFGAWTSNHFEKAFYRKVLADVWLLDTTISAVDAETGEALGELGMAWPDPPRGYRKVARLLPGASLLTTSSDETGGMAMRIRQVVAWPVKVTVSSHGYEAQAMELLPGEREEIVVPLKRLGT